MSKREIMNEALQTSEWWFAWATVMSGYTFTLIMFLLTV